MCDVLNPCTVSLHLKVIIVYINGQGMNMEFFFCISYQRICDNFNMPAGQFIIYAIYAILADHNSPVLNIYLENQNTK